MKDGATVLYATEALGERVSQYSEANSLTLPKYITEYHAKIVKDQPTTSTYMISTFQSQALVWLARLVDAKRVLEIGVFVGYSAMVWSHAIGPEGEVTGFEFNEQYAKQASEALAKHSVENCEIIVGNAVEQLPTYTPTDPYDIIFIDAQKSGYPSYLHTILSRSAPGSRARLLRPGGLIIADNILRRGLVPDSSEDNPWRQAETINTSAYWKSDDIRCLREFNEAVRASGRLEQLVLPLWDGVSLARIVD